MPSRRISRRCSARGRSRNPARGSDRARHTTTAVTRIISPSRAIVGNGVSKNRCVHGRCASQVAMQLSLVVGNSPRQGATDPCTRNSTARTAKPDVQVVRMVVFCRRVIALYACRCRAQVFDGWNLDSLPARRQAVIPRNRSRLPCANCRRNAPEPVELTASQGGFVFTQRHSLAAQSASLNVMQPTRSISSRGDEPGCHQHRDQADDG
jgi:hypothetical protein